MTSLLYLMACPMSPAPLSNLAESRVLTFRTLSATPGRQLLRLAFLPAVGVQLFQDRPDDGFERLRVGSPDRFRRGTDCRG